MVTKQRDDVKFGVKNESSASFGPNEPQNREGLPPFSRTPADLPPGDFAGWGQEKAGAPLANKDVLSEEEKLEIMRKAEERGWTDMAREMFNLSTTYMNANITPAWERSLAHFHNQHAPGTHYWNQNFKKSRVFRPMTRSNIKAQEASMSAAVFSTQDIVEIEAQDKSSEAQSMSAKMVKYCLEYRLETLMPWFQTVMGAYQDTKVHGICASHQYWRYQEIVEIVPAFDSAGNPEVDEDGNLQGEERIKVSADELVCDNIPPENIRFNPMCDWRDPANTSSFIVYTMPMDIDDAIVMMTSTNAKTGQPTWMYHDKAAMLASRVSRYERTRQAREGNNRVDPAEEFDSTETRTVWAHLNIIRRNGTDMAFWTMGTDLLLTKPIPLKEMYPHLREKERPFVIGTSTIETHRNYPASDAEQGAGLQEEVNAIANQRMDNVKLVLNKRYFVRRGSQTDLDALMRNVPGGGVMLNDVEKDVKVVSTEDVTSSSYQEQDRLSTEFDGLVGNMSQSSVMANRKLNETVGGMSMMGQSANSVQDYGIRVFLLTWMQPVLRQLVRLEQMYESDTVMLGLAAEQAGVFQRFGMDADMDLLLEQNLTTRVNVGMGNTDPVRRVERIAYGVEKVIGLPGIAERVKSQKVADEIFGSLGFRDGKKFVRSDEEQDAYVKANPPQPDPEIALKQEELRVREDENKMRHERESKRIEEEITLKYAELALKNEMTLEQMYAKLDIEKMRNQTARDLGAAKVAQTSAELNMKRATGSGI